MNFIINLNINSKNKNEMTTIESEVYKKMSRDFINLNSSNFLKKY